MFYFIQPFFVLLFMTRFRMCHPYNIFAPPIFGKSSRFRIRVLHFILSLIDFRNLNRPETTDSYSCSVSKIILGMLPCILQPTFPFGRVVPVR